MAASCSAPVRSFLESDPRPLIAELALTDAQRFRRNEPEQIRAWTVSIETLKSALAHFDAAQSWRIVLEFDMRRLSRRIDAVLVTPRAILVLEFKVGAATFAAAAKRQVEDYALDLQDFHAASRGRIIVPILVATEGQPRHPTWGLAIPGVAGTVLEASAATLGPLLRDVWDRLPLDPSPIDVDAWEHAPYRPVPGIIDAACTLYSRNNVADIANAGADARNLTATTDFILNAIAEAERTQQRVALFVTGIPGAGKTLCGLNAVFGAARRDHAVFLTGNPTLVHVLREALARDAASDNPSSLRAARQRMRSAIQALPAFRDEYVGSGGAPPNRIAVVDEAQRCWSRDYAIRQSQSRAVQLTESEPAHLLDIMARRDGWSVMVCLVGHGQEIHNGEGGLAEWGEALRQRPQWRAIAGTGLAAQTDPRLRLPSLPQLRIDDRLHLDVPVRSIRNAAAAPWVDAVLAGNAAAAWRIAQDHGPIPFLLTRDAAAMCCHLRAAARGLRRPGLVASSGAKRLRADGYGVELPHMDDTAVAHWFLDRWPDVRASDALEQIATEFSCQGLELDLVGLCWGGDLVRGQAWRVRKFSGTKWQSVSRPEAIANRINTYRVLLTRARYETVIWIPQGNPNDATRNPQELNAVANYLHACGAAELNDPQLAEAAPMPDLFADIV